jgi:DNA polymerase-3 subunit beta
MKIKIEVLTAALKIAGAVVNKRHKTPILQCVSLSAWQITGTDCDTFISVPLDDTGTDVFHPVCVNLADILARVSALPKSTEITLTSEPGIDKLIIQHDGNISKLNVLSTVDYPIPRSVDTLEDTLALNMPADTLRTMMSHVIKAMSQQDVVRYYLNGMCFNVHRGYFNLIATDGHRLHRVSSRQVGLADYPDSIMPGDAVTALYKMLPKKDSDIVELNIYKTAMHFKLPDGSTVQSRLIEGRFPDYERVIPARKDRDRTLTTDRAGLLAVLKRLKPAVKESFYGVRINCAKDTVTLGTASGDITESMPATWEGEPLKMGVNINYLIDALESATGDDVALRMLTANDSVLIDGDDFQLVVMPMRV